MHRHVLGLLQYRFYWANLVEQSKEDGFALRFCNQKQMKEDRERDSQTDRDRESERDRKRGKGREGREGHRQRREAYCSLAYSLIVKFNLACTSVSF